MVTLRLGHSLFAVLLLVSALGGVAICTLLAVMLGSGLAAGGAALFAGMALYVGWILVRRSRQVPGETVVMGGLGGAAVSQPAFLTFARHTQGLWNQRGVVMIADHGGIFLPMGFARHLLVDMVLTLFVPTVRFADVSFDIGGSSPEAMADAVRRHGGFALGPDWVWNGPLRSLHRAPSDGVLVLEHAPEGRMDQFAPAVEPTLAELRWRMGVAVVGGLVVSAGLVSVGGVGAVVLDDVEVLWGFVAFAGLVMTAVVIAVGVVWKHRSG